MDPLMTQHVPKCLAAQHGNIRSALLGTGTVNKAAGHRLYARTSYLIALGSWSTKDTASPDHIGHVLGRLQPLNWDVAVVSSGENHLKYHDIYDYLLSTRQNYLDALHEEESTEFNLYYPQGGIFLCNQQT